LSFEKRKKSWRRFRSGEYEGCEIAFWLETQSQKW